MPSLRVGVLCFLPTVLQAASFNSGIPLSIATVVDENLPNDTSLPEFILIQDIHRHPEAQTNIAALLLHAHHHWDLTTAYLEGAYSGQAALPVASNKPLRTRLADGTLSGAEMASLMVKTGDLRLEGIEDPGVYRDNVEAYQAAQDQLSRAMQEIKTVRLLQQTWDLTQRRFSDEQLDRLELLARLKLKPAEYVLYLQDKERQPCPAALAGTLEAAERFYRLADRRSRIFIEGALHDTNRGPKALITGGFHTAEMAKELRAAGKSFVILSPHVTRSGYEYLYTDRMNETISALKLQ